MMKKNKIFWGVGFFCVALFLYVIGYNYYDRWRGERNVEKLAEALQQMEQEIYNKKAADKIGGRTPQETLDLFIKAVESGDYELASKYFVIEKQDEWRNNLITANNISEFLSKIKILAKSSGSYSEKGDYFSLHGSHLISFIFYPSGNWKIEEI